MSNEPMVYVVMETEHGYNADGDPYLNDYGRPVLVAFTKDDAEQAVWCLQRAWNEDHAKRLRDWRAVTWRGGVPEIYYLEQLPLRWSDLNALPVVLTQLEEYLSEWGRQNFRSRVCSMLRGRRGFST